MATEYAPQHLSKNCQMPSSFLLKEVVCMDIMIFVCLQHALTFMISYKDIKIFCNINENKHIAKALKTKQKFHYS